MQFMLQFSIPIDKRDVAQERFQATGALPPDGVNMLGRWHCSGERRGYMLVETDDLTLITKFMREWSDVLEFQMAPVITDQQLAQVMAS